MKNISMSFDNLRLLHINSEKSEHDELEDSLKAEHPDFQIHWARSAENGRQRIKAEHWDCIVCALSDAGPGDTPLVAELRAVNNLTPFILLCGPGKEEQAIEAFRGGASDCVFNMGEEASYKYLAASILKNHKSNIARKELEGQADIYKSIINSSPNAMYFYRLVENGDLVFLGANPRADEILGFDHNSLKGKTIEEAFPALVDTEIPELYRKIARRELEHQTFEIPYESENINGYFSVFVYPTMRDEIAVDFVDISKRRKIEQDLAKSQAILSNALQLGKIGHWEYIVAEDKFIFTDEFYDMFGTTAEEMGGYEMSPQRYAELFIPPEERHLVGVSIENLIKTNDPNYSAYIEHKFLYADGSVGDLAVKFKVEFDESGTLVKTFGVNQDISARKQREQELEISKARYEFLFNKSPFGVVILDPSNGRILEFNDKVCKQLGYTRDEFETLTVADVEATESPEAVKEHINNILERGWDDFETTHRTKSGEIRDIHVIAQVLYFENHDIYHCVWRDITEQKQAARLLVESRNELERANKELEAFSYTVSHDLKSPILQIEGLANILQRDYSHAADEQGNILLNHIVEVSHKLHQLVDDILFLSRATKGELRYNDVDLTELARSCADELRQREPEKAFEIEIQADMTAYGDSNLLKVVMDNLIGNAWKYSSKRENPVIQVGSRIIDQKKAFYVSDNGVGFPQDRTEEVFEAFIRLHSPSEFKGSGIGLATVKRIIKRHGGRIWAESKIGGGATFYFSLD